MKKYVIIVAGGTGTRMQGDIPKQFMLLCGKPVILHSIEAFLQYDATMLVILVIHIDYLAYWEQLCTEFNISLLFKVVLGGETRFESVKNGLTLVEEEGLVAVHDAARPLVSADFIESIFAEAEANGSAMPGIILNDTIRFIVGDTSHQLDRTFIRAMQTPQVYKASELKRAYEQPYQPLFTDDASVMQSAGFPLHLTGGRPDNIKITHPQDIVVAEALMNFLTTET